MTAPGDALDVLAVAPHPDDLEITCGGTLALLVKQGHRVGMLDLTTTPQDRRTIGELVIEPLPAGLTQPLTGFENHRGGTALGPAASPLGAVVKGAGNPTNTPTGINQDYIAGSTANPNYRQAIQ